MDDSTKTDAGKNRVKSLWREAIMYFICDFLVKRLTKQHRRKFIQRKNANQPESEQGRRG